MKDLGASEEFGDIDVMAWRGSKNSLLVIECKRLKPARTVGEVCEQLQEFAGEASDRLNKHLKRVEWINSNLDLVEGSLKLDLKPKSVVPLMVTNVVVPMQFNKDLPLSNDLIVPLKDMEHLLETTQ
jgi:hypothetical protein